jgi:hypothetical protein
MRQALSPVSPHWLNPEVLIGSVFHVSSGHDDSGTLALVTIGDVVDKS